MLPIKLLANCPREYQLNVHEVPVQFREFGIYTGYRKPRCSVSQCLRSAFWPTNETLNFWTHFLPFWYFFGKFYELYKDDAFVLDSYHWPFMAYLSTVCAWPICSCFAHLFSVLSEEVRHVCFFLDYLSLSWYSFGAAVAYHAYAFDELFFNTWFSRYYVHAAATAAFGCTLLACQSRFILTSKWRKFIRVISFVLPFATESVPLAERLIRRYWTTATSAGSLHQDSHDDDDAITYHSWQFFWAATGIIFYCFHIPEALFPGKFDIVGHSHQILHVCGVLATYNQLWGCYFDMINRRQLFNASNVVVKGGIDLSWVLLLLLADIFTVAAFTIRLYFQRRYYGLKEMDKNK